MASNMLKTTDLTKKIGSKVIVSDINLEVNQGEIFGFLGPNGAGKTTTIKMIVGLSSITKGDILVDGHSVKKDFRKAIENVGCIVENPELYKNISGLDNLKLFAKLYSGVNEERINEVIDLVEMGYAAKNKVKTYSLGMKQRIGVAAALLNHPKLLILDEPTNGLDPAGILAMRNLFKKLSKEENMAILISSHILSEMQQMCDRVGIINHGKMVTVRSVDELISLAENKNAETLTVSTDNNDEALKILSQQGFEVKVFSDGIHVASSHTKIPEIIAALVNSKINVYGVSKLQTASLEDVFIKLTQGA